MFIVFLCLGGFCFVIIDWLVYVYLFVFVFVVVTLIHGLSEKHPFWLIGGISSRDLIR